jgi:hypothetical protein
VVFSETSPKIAESYASGEAAISPRGLEMPFGIEVVSVDEG